MNDCVICCETMNKSTRLKVTCPYCQFSQCLTCFKMYLLGSVKQNPECMSCHRELSLDFIAESTPKVFHNQEYRTKRADMLHSQERSLLPDTQHLVETIKEQRRKDAQIEELMDEARYLKIRMSEIQVEITRIRYPYPDRNTIKPVVERKKFMMGCPAEECRGFLSQAWKCGTCDVYVCSKCRVIKGAREDAAHECNPDNVATAKMLHDETKPCPSCAAPIFKISGCFAPETPILMFNGTNKRADEIVIGDELVGDDGAVRNVTHLVSGYDQMYLVKQNKGDSYVVNSEHMLVLHFAGQGSIKYYDSLNKHKFMWFDTTKYTFNTKNFDSYEEAYQFKIIIEKDQLLEALINIPIKKYLALPDSIRLSRLKGVKISDSINWSYKNIEIESYILGSWLGDGYSNGKEFCTNDQEILEYWQNWALQNNSEVVKTANKYRYYVRKSHDSITNYNPLKAKLSVYGLINNKHIPNDYLINSKDVRLKLLAGIIDTDGCVQNDGRRIIIITVIGKLANNIEFLAKSLGFSVNVNIRKRENVVIFDTPPKNYKDQFVINISGYNLHEIPTILERKICAKQVGGVNLLTTAIEVVSVEYGNYYGWTVDGNHRFLLSDFTVVKNCDQMYHAECGTAFSWNTGKIDKGVVHNPHFYEWQRAQNNGVAPRVPGDRPNGGCGGLPWDSVVRRCITDRGIVFENWMQCYLAVNHITHVVMHLYPAHIGLQDNSDLRVKFLMNDIDEATWAKTLCTRQKKAEKNHAVHQILELLTVSLTDLFTTFAAGDTENIAEAAEALKDYVNREFMKISKRYNNKTLFLTHEWRIL